MEYREGTPVLVVPDDPPSVTPWHQEYFYLFS